MRRFSSSAPTDSSSSGNPPTPLSPLPSQRLSRLYPQGTPQRRDAGEQANKNHHTDARAKGDSEARPGRGMTVTQVGQSEEPHGQRSSKERTQPDLYDGSAADTERYRRLLRAQRRANPDLSSALRDRKGHDGVDPGRGERDEDAQDDGEGDGENHVQVPAQL